MANTKNTPLIPRVIDWANRFTSVVDDSRRLTIDDWLKPMTDRLTMGLFRVVVMGEIKKGKTSFICALLGEYDLLPTDIEISTSTVYKIIYGPQQTLTVFFLPDEDGNTPEPMEITAEKLQHYGTEAGNPDNQKMVDFIGLTMPNPLLKKGLAIIDTPGLGGLFNRHREITQRYVPSADAVFFVTDSVESPISQEESEFLKILRKHTEHLYFIQTKTSIAGTEQVVGWHKRNLKILSQMFDDRPEQTIPYFPVDSMLKRQADQCSAPDTAEGLAEREQDLRDSGFADVYRFVHRYLLPSKEHMLAIGAMRQLKHGIAGEGTCLQDRVRIVRETNKDRLDALEKELREALISLREWQQGGSRETEKKFREQLEDLKQEYRAKIQELFNPNGMAFGEYSQIVCEKFTSAAEVGKRAQDILNDYTAYCNEQAQGLISAFQQQFAAIFQKAMQNNLQFIEAGFNGNFAHTTKVAKIDGSLDDAIRTGVLQGTMASGVTAGMFSIYFGGSITQVLMAIGIGSLNPLGLAVAGSIVAAGAIYGVRGYRKVQSDKLDIAKRKVEESLQKIAHLGRISIGNEFIKITTHLERNANAELERLFTETQKELTSRLEVVKQYPFTGQ